MGSLTLVGEGHCTKRGVEHERFKAGAAKRTRPIQDREIDGESKINGV